MRVVCYTILNLSTSGQHCCQNYFMRPRETKVELHCIVQYFKYVHEILLWKKSILFPHVPKSSYYLHLVRLEVFTDASSHVKWVQGTNCSLKTDIALVPFMYPKTTENRPVGFFIQCKTMSLSQLPYLPRVSLPWDTVSPPACCTAY